MTAPAAFQAMIATLQTLGRSAREEVAKEAEPLVQAAARSTASAGTDPNGNAWPPLKRGDGQPLAHAADHITAKAAGATIRVYLRGPDVFHHFGGKRVPKRQIIPDGVDVPPAIAEAMQRAAARVFARRLGAS